MAVVIPILPLGKLSSGLAGLLWELSELRPEAGLPKFVAPSPTTEFLTREKTSSFLLSFVDKVLVIVTLSVEQSYAFSNRERGLYY